VLHFAALAAAHPALQAASSSGKGGGSSLPFVILIVVFGIVYVTFLRPRRNKQRAAAAAVRKADVGDRVVTTAALVATVVSFEDELVTLEVAPGVRSQFLSSAIVRRYEPPEEAVAEPTDTASTGYAEDHGTVINPDVPDDRTGIE
jgi:preprotein translocase subunit YajC